MWNGPQHFKQTMIFQYLMKRLADLWFIANNYIVVKSSWYIADFKSKSSPILNSHKTWSSPSDVLIWGALSQNDLKRWAWFKGDCSLHRNDEVSQSHNILWQYNLGRLFLWQLKLYLALSSSSSLPLLTLDHHNPAITDLEVITPLSVVVLTDG